MHAFNTHHAYNSHSVQTRQSDPNSQTPSRTRWWNLVADNGPAMHGCVCGGLPLNWRAWDILSSYAQNDLPFRLRYIHYEKFRNGLFARLTDHQISIQSAYLNAPDND